MPDCFNRTSVRQWSDGLRQSDHSLARAGAPTVRPPGRATAGPATEAVSLAENHPTEPPAEQEPPPAEPIPLRRGHGGERGPDGGDSPAWSRKRPAYQPPPDRSRRPDRRRPGPLRRAARALLLLLPRRRLRPRAAGRGGGRARPAVAGPDRPRRHVRRGPVRRGRRRARAADRVRGRAEPRHPAAGHPGRTRRSRPGSASRTRPARTCWCWPATRPATPACAGRSARPSCAAAPRAGRSMTWTSWPNWPTTTG